MDFCCYSKVSIQLFVIRVEEYPVIRRILYLGPFSIHYSNSHASSLGFILSEFDVGVVSLKILDLLEMRALLYRAHIPKADLLVGVEKKCLGLEWSYMVGFVRSSQSNVARVLVHKFLFVYRRIRTTIVLY